MVVRDTDIHLSKTVAASFCVDLAGCAGCPRGLVPPFR